MRRLSTLSWSSLISPNLLATELSILASTSYFSESSQFGAPKILLSSTPYAVRISICSVTIIALNPSFSNIILNNSSPDLCGLIETTSYPGSIAGVFWACDSLLREGFADLLDLTEASANTGGMTGVVRACESEDFAA